VTGSLFKLTANTAYRCSALGRIEVRSGSRPADAQGRCDGVGSEEIGLPQPSRGSRFGAREGCLFSSRDKQENLHFFGETPERRPWAKTRARLLLPGVLTWNFLWDMPCAYTDEYPIPCLNRAANQPPLESEKMPENYSDNIGAK
jgi:hypothetical protein